MYEGEDFDDSHFVNNIAEALEEDPSDNKLKLDISKIRIDNSKQVRILLLL